MELQPSKVPLKKSSKLIDEAAKLHKAEVNSLLKECYELDMEMALRKTRMVKSDIGSNEGSSDLNVSLENSDQNHGEEYWDRNNHSSSSKRKRRQSTANNSHKKKRSYSGSSTDSSEEMHQSFGDNSSQNSEIMSELDDPTENKETHEKSVQTNHSFLNNLHRKKDSTNASCDSELPFGFVMIFNNRNDRVPSKILFSSFNSRVRDL